MKSDKSGWLAAAMLAAFAAASAQAQTTYVRPRYEYPEQPPIEGPANVEMGESPFFITPYLGVAAGFDDNLFLSHTNEKDSFFWALSPGFKIDGRDPNKVIQLSYQGQIGRYTSSPDDDYVDEASRAQFDMALDPHNFIRLGLDYIRGHEPRGSTDRPGQPEHELVLLFLAQVAADRRPRRQVVGPRQQLVSQRTDFPGARRRVLKHCFLACALPPPARRQVRARGGRGP